MNTTRPGRRLHTRKFLLCVPFLWYMGDFNVPRPKGNRPPINRYAPTIESQTSPHRQRVPVNTFTTSEHYLEIRIPRRTGLPKMSRNQNALPCNNGKFVSSLLGKVEVSSWLTTTRSLKITPEVERVVHRYVVHEVARGRKQVKTRRTSP